MKWAFLGSSPSAPAQFANVLPTLGECRTITTNAGIKLMPAPDVYCLIDMNACQNYRALTRPAKERGTHLVTLRREPSAQRMRGVDWFDEFVPSPSCEPTRDAWGGFVMSGPFCVEYACRNGASEVHLLACEGYREGDEYFDLRERQNRNVKHMTSNQQVRLRLLTQLFPEIRFVIHGAPHYEITSPNWEVRSC